MLASHLCNLGLKFECHIISLSLLLVELHCLLNPPEFTKFDYIERRKTLQKPSEQEKLLNMVPEVIAEELEPEGTTAAASGEAEVSDFSPKSILRGSSDVSSMDASGELISILTSHSGSSHELAF